MKSQPATAVVEESRTVRIAADDVTLSGDLCLPPDPVGLVLFAHGSGSSRSSPRNQFVGRILRESSIGTLLFDLLTSDEESVDYYTRQHRFNIGMLAARLAAATEWLETQPDVAKLRVGYFGASTGGAAALVAAAELGSKIGAIVSRGGRPDLAGDFLERVVSPTLLIVGERDYEVIKLNIEAIHRLKCEKELRLVAKATHLFEEPGALEEVAQLAAHWFGDHLPRP